MHIRRVENQSVPLALNVILLRLLSDVEAIKLQLSCKFFLPFEDHQWNLYENNSISTAICSMMHGVTCLFIYFDTLRQL